MPERPDDRPDASNGPDDAGAHDGAGLNNAGFNAAAPEAASTATAHDAAATDPASAAATPNADFDLGASWLASLDGYAGSDTMLNIPSGPRAVIDLTHAHPSGMAQLLSGRRTRLTTLLRDPAHLAQALGAAAALSDRTQELDANHGISAASMVFGTASFTSQGAGTQGRLTAPVMFASMSLDMRPGGDDYDIQIDGPTMVNPALIRQLSREYAVAIDPDALLATGSATGRFDPHPVLEELRHLAGSVPGMNVEYKLLATTLADLSERLSELPRAHSIIGALIDGTDGVMTASHRYPPLDEREPADEFLVLDADSSQQEVLDLIRAGNSLVVRTPPGTGHTQTALNAVATLVAQGKTVLVTAERKSALGRFREGFDALGLGSTVLDVRASQDPASLRETLIQAILRNEQSAAPDISGVHETLAAYRNQLAEHVDSLHQKRDRWQCSPYDAMQALAELTAADPAPATHVRLKRSVLDGMHDRTDVAQRLRRASELGAFSRAASNSPWYGARLMNRQQTVDAHRLASELRVELPPLRTDLDELARTCEIKPANSIDQWREYLALLVAVRASLDKFNPDIFDRPISDLSAATASNAWRRERGIDMNSVQRSRLRRVAKEYIRPGVHIADLHASLRLVEVQRQQWGQIALSQRHPRVPTGLADIARHYEDFADKLRQLADVLPQTGDSALAALPLEQLEQRLVDLVADEETLQTLPERTMLLESMREHGIGELLTDLAQREVEPDAVAAELELTWWQSVLEAMISGDERLAMASGPTLRKVEADYRLADQAAVAAGPARLRWILAAAWRRSIERVPGQAEALRASLRTGSMPLPMYLLRTPDLVQPLTPVLTASPFDLPEGLPAGFDVDALVVLDAQATSLPAALPAIAKSKQVVAFGDDQLDSVSAFSVDAGVDPAQFDPSVQSALQALSRVLDARRLTTVHRGLDDGLTMQLSEDFYDGELAWLPRPPSHAYSDLTVEYLPDGVGMPTSDGNVESTDAEVARVVDLVLEHAANHPDESLAVVCGNRRHASRVADAVQRVLGEQHAYDAVFAPGPETFRVVDISRAAGLRRDRIILSLGFGRTPHGRVLHGLGALSEDGGRTVFLQAVTRARKNLTVLTCLHPDALDRMKLREGGLELHRLLERGLPYMAPDSDAARDAAAADEALSAGLHRSAGAHWDTTGAALDSVAAYEGDGAVSANTGDENRFAGSGWDAGLGDYSGSGHGEHTWHDSHDSPASNGSTALGGSRDALLTDLAERIRERGVRVDERVDGIDLTARLESGGGDTGGGESGAESADSRAGATRVAAPVALTTDGAPAYRRLSVRERSRLRPAMFERAGWQHQSLWTIEIFTDPESIADRVGELLDAPGAGSAESAYSDDASDGATDDTSEGSDESASR